MIKLKPGKDHSIDIKFDVEDINNEYSGYSLHICAKIEDNKFICPCKNKLSIDEFNAIKTTLDRFLFNLRKYNVEHEIY